MSQYIISKIYASNFKGIKNKIIKTIDDLIIINFENEGLVVLAGPNGYGKTTIFDIVEIIFTRKITRVNSTKYGNRNLKDSGLLNDERFDGIIGVELISKKDDSDIITIIGEISKDTTIKDFTDSMQKINIHYRRQILTNEDIKIDFQLNFSNFKLVNQVSEIEGLEDVTSDIYNIFYYISQEESNHFLKQKENEKVNIFDNLLGIDSIVMKEDVLSKILSGNRNDRISKVISDKEAEIKDKIGLLNADTNENYQVEYIKLFEDENEFKWDDENLNNYKTNELNQFIDSINTLENLLIYRDDFLIFRKKKEINKLFDNVDTIKNYLDLRSLNIVNNDDSNVDLEKVTILVQNIKQKKTLESVKSILMKHEIDNNLTFDMVEQCMEILDFQIDMTKDEFDNSINIIKGAEKVVLENESVISRLLNIRRDFITEITNASKKEKISSDICPLCGTDLKKYNKDLFKEIEITTNQLEESTSRYAKELKRLREDLQQQFIELRNRIEEYIENNKQISLDNDRYERMRVLSQNATSQKNLKQFMEVYSRLDYSEFATLNPFSIETFKNALLEKTGVNSNEFISVNIDNKLEFAYETYFNGKSNKFNLFVTKIDGNYNLFEEKRKYIKKIIAEIEHNKNSLLNKEIRNLVKEVVLLEKLKINMKIYFDIYNKEISTFRDNVMIDIEIPLYIYTGKILQNYQRGLGVFVKRDKNRINFVPSISSDHEIINTFSSGQLSGFVIAFLLVMNKVYTVRNNQFSVILIDDPVQTMDDINIASLVDVLRKEFSDKQLFLSTHEEQKAQYIIYKFYKYDIRHKYIDVKKELYSVG